MNAKDAQVLSKLVADQRRMKVVQSTLAAIYSKIESEAKAGFYTASFSEPVHSYAIDSILVELGNQGYKVEGWKLEDKPNYYKLSIVWQNG